MASSRSTAASGVSEDARSLISALPEHTFEVIEEVEERLEAVGRRAPESLTEPAVEALTSGGKRLRPLLLALCAGMGVPDREDLLKAATAIEILHTA
ncbi:MAG: hypothetical protein ACRDSJ_15655, partial [Rubrobacteraceae bacterium]